MEYYAHSARPEKRIPNQLYTEHIDGVRAHVREYLSSLSPHIKSDGALLDRLMEMVAVYHDLGKLTQENQEVLSGKYRRKALPQNHVDAGVAHFFSDSCLAPIAAVVVQSHHVGLPEFAEEREKEGAAFRDDKIMPETDLMLPELEQIHNSLIKSNFSYDREEFGGDLAIFLRVMLSCLVDADHTDTGIHYQSYPAVTKTIPLRPKERLLQLDRYVDGLGEKKDGHIRADSDERNILRKEMYLACRAAVIDGNISSCDSPVGSGKTTAIMAHLLAQAEKRKLRRIFVVLPFTNIITQSVAIYRDALVLPGENAEEVVAELHHRADFESVDVRHLTALWRAPIVVMTAVTFFETLASRSTATLRRLHELPGSAIFVDESHATLPAHLLPLAWKWMMLYASEWGCYWVLASGSLNRFWKIREIAQGACDRDVPEIVDDNLRKRLAIYENSRISYPSDLRPKDVDELANWVIHFPGPRLVILNTVQSAAVLADFFLSHYGHERVEHLSTSLAPNDREKTLKKVKERLASPEDTDWTFIATSCVEAGVDLSFRTGFRELGSLVSLLQAAGRINRKGMFADAQIWTFCIADGNMFKSNPGMKESAAILRGYFERNIEIIPELSTQSIEDEIRLGGLSRKYEHLLNSESNKAFRSVECNFKVIATDTRIVVVDADVAEKIRHGGMDWQELQKQSVQIPAYKLKELGIQEIIEGTGIYKWNLKYDDFLGYMAGIVELKKLEGQGMIV